jgi:uncharacterized protein
MKSAWVSRWGLSLKVFRIVLWVYFVLASTLALAQIPDAPKPTRLCNDLSGTLQPNQIQELEQSLVVFDQETSVQICLVVVTDLGGFEVSDYATRLFEKWGIGRGKQDDGILLLLSLQERKIRIETGYGLESVVTDALSRRIIEENIVPALRREGVAAGLKAGSSALMSLIRGDYQDQAARTNQTNEDSGGGSASFWILLAVFLVIILLRGGGGGGRSVDRDGTRGMGGPLWFPSGGFGGGSGGGGGFGGFGGGFGGFGGGMSGGGGASGSW